MAMNDLLANPVIDKAALLGGCVRLPLTVDGARLAAEVGMIPPEEWGAAGRVGVHRAAESLFLRGHAPAEGQKPIEDRPILDTLPYARAIIGTVLPADPLRALLARLPAGAEIRPHVDSGPLLARTIRIHVPVETNERVWMLCDGNAYRMIPGEVWALNNGAEHGVWNRDAERSRTHMICDFLPSPELLALVAKGERGLGIPIGEAEAIDSRHR
jgi:hypothetical protein